MKLKRRAAAVAMMLGCAGWAHAQEAKTYTGTVSDAMCSAKHDMGVPDPVKCTRECVKNGSAYALVVGSKVYTLQGDTSGLDKFAGAKASVTGTMAGDTITVKSVSAAKS